MRLVSADKFSPTEEKVKLWRELVQIHLNALQVSIQSKIVNYVPYNKLKDFQLVRRLCQLKQRSLNDLVVQCGQISSEVRTESPDALFQAENLIGVHSNICQNW